MARRTTALLIPCSWSGDENDPVPHSYRAWIWLYTCVQQVRHRLGFHAYRFVPALNGRRCTWCGKNSA